MAESTSFNVQAFSPFQGGLGKRLTVTTSSVSMAIPGMAGGHPVGNARVLVSNSGGIPVFVRLGSSDVIATTDCLEILPGTAYLLTPPIVGPGGVWLAAIIESGSAKISVVFGEGT